METINCWLIEFIDIRRKLKFYQLALWSGRSNNDGSELCSLCRIVRWANNTRYWFWYIPGELFYIRRCTRKRSLNVYEFNFFWHPLSNIVTSLIVCYSLRAKLASFQVNNYMQRAIYNILFYCLFALIIITV